MITNYNSLSDLYAALEQSTDFFRISYDSISNISQENAQAANLEVLASQGVHLFEINKDYSNAEQTNNLRYDYFVARIAQTSNNFLIARYAHIAYLLKPSKQYAQIALNAYISLLSLNLEPTSYDNISKYIIEIASSQRVMNIAIDAIKAALLSDIPYRAKYYILQNISDQRSFKISDFDFIPELCHKIAESLEAGIFKENVLMLGLLFARKDSTKYNSLILTFNELLGDNAEAQLHNIEDDPSNIALPQLNQNIYLKMMEYYKQAKNEKKYNHAHTCYNENKKNLKYLTFQSKVPQDPQITKIIYERYNSIMDRSSNEILAYLCDGDPYVFPPEYILQELTRHSKTIEGFETISVDINGNSRKVDEYEFHKFHIFHTCISNQFQYLASVVQYATQKKKLSYSLMRKFLLKTAFGIKYPFNRGNLEYNYTWFEQIDFVLKEYFKQMNRMLNNKTADWRNVIDILPSKFEGIMRDIVYLSGGSTIKMTSNNDTIVVLLEDLLKSESLKQFFNQDDINLFVYTFTKKGYNIRNNVAHGFYKPQDYSFFYATLVLLCVLRLVKYTI